MERRTPSNCPECTEEEFHEELSLCVFHMAHDPIRSILRNRQRWIIHDQLIAIRARRCFFDPSFSKTRARETTRWKSHTTETPNYCCCCGNIYSTPCATASDVDGTAAGGAWFPRRDEMQKHRDKAAHSRSIFLDRPITEDPRCTKNLALAYCFTSVRTNERTNERTNCRRSVESVDRGQFRLHNGRYVPATFLYRSFNGAARTVFES